MKYAILKISNGNFSIESEWNDNLLGAKAHFHSVCATLWNEPTVETATVELINQIGRVVEDYTEFISHTVEQE